MYELAPVPVILVDVPAQIVDEVTVVPTRGIGFTVINLVATATHPSALVPVTVYVVVAAGVTLMVVPLKAPGFHV